MVESQNKQILTHLQAGGTLTPLDALYRYGCFRLAARINDLRRAGHVIDVRIVPVTSPKAIPGKKHVAQYYMRPGASK